MPDSSSIVLFSHGCFEFSKHRVRIATLLDSLNGGYRAGSADLRRNDSPLTQRALISLAVDVEAGAASPRGIDCHRLSDDKVAVERPFPLSTEPT